MSIVNVETGVSTIGNSSNEDVALDNVNSKIKSFKTLIDGTWRSWSAGAPDAFQGFIALEKGKGFVVNSDGETSIQLGDAVLDINNADIKDGLNFLCFPYVDKEIIEGYLPRIKATSIKTIIDNWKSWSAGAPDAFQGFLSTNKEQGYVVNVEAEYDSYLSTTNRDISNGARIGSSFMNEVDISVPSNPIVIFESDSIFSSIEYEDVTIDTNVSKIDLWVRINGIVKLIQFPVELMGTSFSIKEKLLDIITYGLINEGSTEVSNYGNITDAPDETIDYGDLSGGHLQTSVIYIGNFLSIVGNSESNPLDITDTIDVSSMELIYDIKTLGSIINNNKMLVTVGGTNSVLEFADEYIGSEFVLIKDSVVYSGVFTVSNSNFITL